MKHFLEPIVRIPGVRTVALTTPDGVPIAALGSPRAARGPIETSSGEDALDANALAALATSWMGDVARASAPLSWEAPVRLVLRAARGTLIVQAGPGAVLVVLLEGGVRHEDLRLPMDSAVARMQRHLRTLERASEIPGVLPSSPIPAREASRADQTELAGGVPAGATATRAQDIPGPTTSGD